MMLAPAAGLGAYAYARPIDLFRLAVGARLRLSGIRPRRARLPRAEIRYWAGGQGTPLMFVHGFGTEAALNWYAQLLAACRHAHVVAPDLPGFGRSQRIVEPGLIALQVDCLGHLLDHLGIERVQLVGHSMGGWISLAFAAAHPARVERLIVVDAAGLRFEPHPRLAQVLLAETVADVRELIAANFQRPPWLPDFVLRDVARTSRRELGMRAEILGRLALSEEFLDGRLAQVVTPTLIVWGRSDSITPVALGERLAAEIPDSQLVVFEDCAHSPNVEQPARFNALLLDFLSAPATPALRHSDTA